MAQSSSLPVNAQPLYTPSYSVRAGHTFPDVFVPSIDSLIFLHPAPPHDEFRHGNALTRLSSTQCTVRAAHTGHRGNFTIVYPLRSPPLRHLNYPYIACCLRVHGHVCILNRFEVATGTFMACIHAIQASSLIYESQ